MTGVAFVVGALSNVFFFNESGKIAIAAAGGNDKIIPVFIKTFVPAWFGIIFFLALIAAAMSTLSSQFHAMGTAIGRDFYQKSLQQKGNTILITRTSMLLAIILSVILAFLANKLDASMQIIATGTALFFGLCAAAFLPAYLSALYVRNISTKAVIAGMIAGFSVGIFCIFFVHEKEAASLQLCDLLFGKTSIVKDTALAKLAMIDPIIFSFPASVLTTAVGYFVTKNKISESHIEKCYNGV
jgi:SSS family solute:Na+ symporter